MRKKICSKCGSIIRDKSHKCERVGKIMKAKKELSEGDKGLKTYRWKKKREYIMKRDNYHCIRCWIVNGRIVNKDLQIHHIKNRQDYPYLIYDNSNLVTLCQSCNLHYRNSNELDFEYDKLNEDRFVL